MSIKQHEEGEKKTARNKYKLYLFQMRLLRNITSVILAFGNATAKQRARERQNEQTSIMLMKFISRFG